MKINSDLYRTLVLTILGAIAVIVVSLANRDVYSKEQIDTKLEATRRVQATLHGSLEADIKEVREDVRWMVRQMGGTPYAETGQDSNTP